MHEQFKNDYSVSIDLKKYIYVFIYILDTLGNVRQCKEIMKHSIELNVPLPQAQQSRLIHMVLNNKHQQKINKEVTAIIFKLMF